MISISHPGVKPSQKEVESQIDFVLDHANRLLSALTRYVRGSCLDRLCDSDRKPLLQQVERIDAHRQRVVRNIAEMNIDIDSVTMEGLLKDNAALADLVALEEMVCKHRSRPLHHSMVNFRHDLNSLHAQF